MSASELGDPTPGATSERSPASRFAAVLRAVGRPIARMARAGVNHWRSSMQMRTVSLTLLLAIAAVAVVGGYLSTQIRDGLFEQRTEQILAETQRSTLAVQAQFDASTAKVPGDVLSLLQSVGNSLQVSAGSAGIFLLRSPDTQIVFPDLVFIRDLRELVTPELRSAVTGSDVQQWQSVAIPGPDGGTIPGVLVGATVTPPVVGEFQLYLLYSLADQQETLGFIQRTLALAAAVLLGLVGLMTWLVTAQVVRPVQVAARSAERYADGHLDERMPLKGRDEVGRLAASFNEMAASLQDQIERMESLSSAQRRFVSDVSHELRTPLTTVRMAADLLYEQRGAFDRNAARAAELLNNQLDRFEALLADLLEISRFDAGAALLDAEERDVRSIVTRAVDALMPVAQREGVWVQVNLPNMQCSADVDAGRVERIVRNLLANAIEHAEGKPVEVHVGADSLAVAVVVRDHGVGLTDDAAEHVFDRFWRADPARTRTIGGTGLGLAIALEDARLHGGQLEAIGSPGKGASFRLTLPRRTGITVTRSPLDLLGAPVRTDRPDSVESDRAASRQLAAGPGPLDLPDLSSGPIAIVAEPGSAGLVAAADAATGGEAGGTVDKPDLEPAHSPFPPEGPSVLPGPRTDWVPVPTDDGGEP